ncbi:hypothetical protein ACMA1I_20185 [Pontibacter sp. 13R65]|uniref:nSTAND1 domain-containing NTPase n=1 Tax=Pontibacter sp. 13R65 TaxID=3127458 RepID=UPI00301CE622
MENRNKNVGSHVKEPYVGPRPFEELDEEFFFGREQETTELASLIIAHPIVLLYAQSGAGKTSLLNASLVPLLKRRKLEVFPPARVRGQTTELSDFPVEANIYIFNALNYLLPKKLSTSNHSSINFKDYLQAKPNYSKRDINPIRVLIFDQFEEIFTIYPERFDDRQDFFEQISYLLKNDPLLRVVFAMREDYIAELDPFAPKLPEKLNTRYRLSRLNEYSARAAIEKPLEKINSSELVNYSFEPDALDRIIDSLRTIIVRELKGERQILGPYVEPVHLQVVCQTLWRKLEASFKEKVNLGVKEIKVTVDDVKFFGNVNNALSEFYEFGIRKAVEATNRSEKFSTLKTTEGALRSWFGRILITPEGTRSTVFSSRKENSVFGIPKIAVRELENHRLIRAELRGGEIWYELSHDRLIQPIRKSNDEWLLLQPAAQRIGQILEDKAAEWVRLGRDRRRLILDQTELKEALDWINSPEGSGLGYSDTLLAYIQSSQTIHEQKRSQRLLLGGIVAVILLATFVGMFVYSLQKRKEANISLKQAEEYNKYAQLQEQLAKAERDSVIYFAKQLEQKNILLEEQSRKLITQSKELEDALNYAMHQYANAVRAQKEAEKQKLLAEKANASLVAQIKISNARADSINQQQKTINQQEKQVKLGYQAAGSVSSPNGRYMVTVSEDKGAELFDLVNGRQINLPEGRYITSANFDLTSEYLAMADLEGSVVIWRTNELKPISRLIGHEDRIRKLIFSPNSKLLATASDDNTARIWDINSEKVISVMQHENSVIDVAFDQYSQSLQLITTTSNGIIRKWDVKTLGSILQEQRESKILNKY